MALVDLPHGTLQYHEAGSGTPIVFLHGYLMGANLWDPVIWLLEGEFRSLRVSFAASPPSFPSVHTRVRCAPTPT
jgi:pimeloyl-ACP methyl ester carboxylesterase